MIKYLGSKRRWVRPLTDMVGALGARSAIDMFSGTTRVAQAFKTAGLHVTAVDSASYAKVLADCYVATDARTLEPALVAETIERLNALPGRAGYVTETFSHRSRFFQPGNAARIDAIRTEIEQFAGSPLHPILLTALLEAADRVDSTTGVQMAYLKSWAPRSYNDLRLRVPALLPGAGCAVQGDATAVAARLPAADIAYLDPPYNQHRYESNYHIWETLVRWDAPEHYGTACKRIDLRDRSQRSLFNGRRTISDALAGVIRTVPARSVIVSYNDESWVGAADVSGWLRDAGFAAVALIEFDSARYVGARIGIHNPLGQRVGTVGRTRNREWMFVAGQPDGVRAAAAAATAHGGMVRDPAASAPER